MVTIPYITLENNTLSNFVGNANERKAVALTEICAPTSIVTNRVLVKIFSRPFVLSHCSIPANILASSMLYCSWCCH